MKYFIHLAYKGTHYQGWQRQANGRGVQAVLEEALGQMFHQKLSLHGCGRTDAGVHANQFFCHTNIEGAWNFDPVFRINKMLPIDIKVYEFIPVSDKANAQLDVISRQYEYHFHLKDNPFLSELSTLYLIDNFSFAAMEKAVNLLPQYRDFLSFCKKPSLYPHTNCEIFAADLKMNNKKRVRFSITANRFLKSMVRIIVGRLLQVASGQLSISEFQDYLENPRPISQVNYAYPQGLYLSSVNYAYLSRPSRGIF